MPVEPSSGEIIDSFAARHQVLDEGGTDVAGAAAALHSGETLRTVTKAQSGRSARLTVCSPPKTRKGWQCTSSNRCHR